MREYSAKRLFLCIALICGFAGMMQVMVFRKRQDLHFKHHADMRFATPKESFEPSGAPVEGEVVAIGMDRIHLSYGKGMKPFRCENPGQYKVGEKLRITYAQGTPATAVRIERIP